MTYSEAIKRYGTFTPGECRDGLYSVCGSAQPADLGLYLAEYTAGLEIEIVATGLLGWPGEDFLSIRFADGQPAGCGFGKLA